MRKIYALFFGLLLSASAWGQTNPTPFDLSTGTYSFTSWAATASAGTYPANMVFQFSNDPTGGGFNPLAPGTGDFNCAYTGLTRSRFLGKDANGVSLIATSNAQFNDCASGTANSTRFVGGVVLGLNTTNRDGILVSWTAGTVVISDGAPTPRTFSLQLQYRVGTTGNFTNVANGLYTSGAAGSSQSFNVILPNAVNNQPVVQIRWVYFQAAQNNGGTRPEIRLDEVSVGSTVLPVTYLDFKARYTAEKLVAVSWTTISETDNAGFDVERSTDASNYITLGHLAGNGTTATRQQYTFNDVSPASGWNYYRLRQTDRDGTSAWSRPVAVLNENSPDDALTLLPNPAGATVQLLLAQGQVAQQAAVISLSGQRLLLPITDGDRLDVGHLPTALYLLEVQTTTGTVFRQRLLKQ